MTKKLSFLEIIDAYVKSDKVHLPPFNKTSIKLQQEIRNPDAKIEKIEKLIIVDSALTSQILKLANSSFFKGLSKVMSIKEAIVRLGLDEITRIILVLTQKQLYNTNDSVIKNFRNNLWRHNLVCALTSQWVAREAGYEELKQDVFFASLMHDIGKLFLITIIEKIKNSKYVPFVPSEAVINEIIKDQHADQGYKVMKQWNIPEQYCRVAKNHHDEKFDPEDIPLVILRLTNKCFNKGINHSESINGEAYNLTSESNLLGFSEIKLAQLEIQIEDSIRRINTHYNL